MLWRSIFFAAILFFVSLADTNVTVEDKNVTLNKERFERFLFKNAMRDYELGSYYEALDEFLQIIKNPKSPFYTDSLLMLGKVYLQIAKRTGMKKYLWTADSYLNIYSSKAKKLGWEYYYTKANIYETLGFYEKALAHYRRSLQKSVAEREQIESIIGILRVAVWLKKLDLVTKYMIILNVSTLQKEQKKELDFIKGMELFNQQKYKEAFRYFEKTYREFESYLIDNPEYYYLVAETAYRKGDIKFAEKLFRRILNLIKNREVLKKALLRMGDIGLKKGNVKSATNYYYQLIAKYPESKEATVAKLKLISLISRDERLAESLKELLPDAEFLTDPESFVVKTLIKNRTNYIGRFALANFGVITFELDSDKLYKRLGWELSLISADRTDYEQKEYFRDLWSSYLLILDHVRVCPLYLSNERFFQEVFEQNILIKISSDLGECKKENKRVALLEYILKRWNNDNNRFLLAKALYEYGDYDRSVAVLNSMKQKGCEFYKLLGKNCVMLDNGSKECIQGMERSLQACSEADFEALILSRYALLMKGKEPKKKFVSLYAEKIASLFEKDPIIKKFVVKYSEALINRADYTGLIRVLEPISQKLNRNCYIDSLLALSYIRTGKMEYAKSLVSDLRKCEDPWSKVAVEVYESEKLKASVK